MSSMLLVSRSFRTASNFSAPNISQLRYFARVSKPSNKGTKSSTASSTETNYVKNTPAVTASNTETAFGRLGLTSTIMEALKAQSKFY